MRIHSNVYSSSNSINRMKTSKNYKATAHELATGKMRSLRKLKVYIFDLKRGYNLCGKFSTTRNTLDLHSRKRKCQHCFARHRKLAETIMEAFRSGQVCGPLMNLLLRNDQLFLYQLTRLSMNFATKITASIFINCRT